jgi:uncharacterized protein YegJ (DUF2314 family)
MPENITEPIKIKREVEIEVTPQALRCLRQANCPVEEFVDWSLNVNKISFGGHNVMLFLEKKDQEEARKNGSSIGK